MLNYILLSLVVAAIAFYVISKKSKKTNKPSNGGYDNQVISDPIDSIEEITYPAASVEAISSIGNLEHNINYKPTPITDDNTPKGLDLEGDWDVIKK